MDEDDDPSNRGDSPPSSESNIVISSYASKVNKHQTPRKDQAIIFNAVDDCKLTDYLLALGPITTNQPASELASSPFPSTQHRQTQITPEGTTFKKTDKILTMQPNSSNTGNKYNTVQIKRIHNEIVYPTADTHSQPEINFTKPLLKKPKHETKANENKCKIMNTDFFLPVKDLIEAHSPPFVLTYDE
ncbi:hypothetical protein HHI36_024371 [Cryptolaemus montrouzieri]|uniref:Uncharacterized protein n=1 Tax=Cryptolaemus montrouzieri TaxID=559131 RepID=A0ABD2NPU0_9CUCU